MYVLYIEFAVHAKFFVIVKIIALYYNGIAYHNKKQLLLFYENLCFGFCLLSQQASFTLY